MKRVFSFYYLLGLLPVYSMSISIYYTPGMLEESIHVKEIFLKKYQIPAELIFIYPTKKCSRIDNRSLNLCLNKKGELLQLSSSNILKLKKSLSTFAIGGKNDN